MHGVPSSRKLSMLIPYSMPIFSRNHSYCDLEMQQFSKREILYPLLVYFVRLPRHRRDIERISIADMSYSMFIPEDPCIWHIGTDVY